MEMSSDFNFTVASWFLWNVHVKHISTHSAGGGYLPSSTQIHRPWVERQGLVGPEMSSKANNILTREIAAGFSP